MSETADRIHALKFAAVLSFVCCMLITGASVGLKPVQLENMELDRQKNVLKAANLIDSTTDLSGAAVKKLFQDTITRVFIDRQGRMISSPEQDGLSLYLHRENNQIASYIVPIDSRGLWGKIRGYMAISSDGQTIVGFSIYSHSETPGLGGEIEKRWFLKNFKNKKIVNQADEFVSIHIAKGKAAGREPEAANMVDGISGATLTGKYLTRGIRAVLEEYEPVSVRFRQGNITIME